MPMIYRTRIQALENRRSQITKWVEKKISKKSIKCIELFIHIYTTNNIRVEWFVRASWNQWNLSTDHMVIVIHPICDALKKLDIVHFEGFLNAKYAWMFSNSTASTSSVIQSQSFVYLLLTNRVIVFYFLHFQK